MVIVPPIMGIIEGGFRLAHLPLFLLWFVGYFLFYCATVWLRSHGKRRYLPPVRAYGIAVVALGLVTLACAPYLWRWAIAFAPLVAFAGWAAWKRDERSLASGLDTVVAACLMLPVMWDVSTGGEAGLRASGHVWALTAMFFGYFAGTVFYVKTNVRKRKSNGYLAASIGWHVAWAIAAAVLASRGDVVWWHAAVWVALAVRAILVPLRGRVGKPVSVKAIGAGEVVTCLVFTASLF